MTISADDNSSPFAGARRFTNNGNSCRIQHWIRLDRCAKSACALPVGKSKRRLFFHRQLVTMNGSADHESEGITG